MLCLILKKSISLKNDQEDINILKITIKVATQFEFK